MRKVEQNGYSACLGVGSFGHAALKKFPYQLTAGHCKPTRGCTNTLYIWSGGGSGLTEDLEARSRGIRDGDTILLQCQSSGWSRSANNWLGFDGSNFIVAGLGQLAVPLTLHAVSGQPHTYTIEHKGGWLGRDGFDMKANQPREHAARVRFDLERFEQTGRVILLCVDNNMIISHRDKGGWMVAPLPVGTQRRRLSLGGHTVGKSRPRGRRDGHRRRHERAAAAPRRSSTRSNGSSAWMAPGRGRRRRVPATGRGAHGQPAGEGRRVLASHGRITRALRRLFVFDRCISREDPHSFHNFIFRIPPGQK